MPPARSRNALPLPNTEEIGKKALFLSVAARRWLRRQRDLERGRGVEPGHVAKSSIEIRLVGIALQRLIGPNHAPVGSQPVGRPAAP